MKRTRINPRFYARRPPLAEYLFGDCGMGADDPTQRPPDMMQKALPLQVYTDAGTIRTVQTILQAKGYDAGAVDGVWGPNTDAGLYRWNVDRGIDPSQAHGPPTDEMLASLGLTHAGATKIVNIEEGSTITADAPKSSGAGLALAIAAGAAALAFGKK